jgi:uncharacterized protein (DUF433 family)
VLQYVLQFSLQTFDSPGVLSPRVFCTRKATYVTIVRPCAWRILKPETPLTATFATQIELDDRGIAWIAGTKVKVTEVVLDKIANGSSPEEIHFQHPNLSLAQIHGALTYYYENQDKVDEQIRRGLEESDKIAVRLSDAEFRRKLLDLKRPL